jgi:flagellar motor component MotA
MFLIKRGMIHRGGDMGFILPILAILLVFAGLYSSVFLAERKSKLDKKNSSKD